MFLVASTFMEAVEQAFSQIPQAVHACKPCSLWISSTRPLKRSCILSVALFSGYCSVTILFGFKKYLRETDRPFSRLMGPVITVQKYFETLIKPNP
jgi:hypothetical protein